MLGTGPWAPQLIPGTVTADPPLQALEAVVLWMPHGTAPQSLLRFSAVGPGEALEHWICAVQMDPVALCSGTVYPAVSVPRHSS